MLSAKELRRGDRASVLKCSRGDVHWRPRPHLWNSSTFKRATGQPSPRECSSTLAPSPRLSSLADSKLVTPAIVDDPGPSQLPGPSARTVLIILGKSKDHHFRQAGKTPSPEPSPTACYQLGTIFCSHAALDLEVPKAWIIDYSRCNQFAIS